MATPIEVGPVPPGTVTGAGPWAVGNTGTEVFAVSRRCRHLRADLAGGSINDAGCLVCPWHHAEYDVDTGRMVKGPQGAFAKVPGLSGMVKALTTVYPLRRGKATETDGGVTVE